ncbi:MAG: transcriptional regulator [Chloroflexi bacterium]|nr:transcriptional regulator [Chloroflexota bacterium]
MATHFVKRDRTARLLRVEHVLSQHPAGLTAREVAERIGVNVRTAYRDLRAIEEELGFPVWEEKGRFGALPGAFLPPLNLTLSEAVTLYLSARLMARFSDSRDDNAIHAFGSLAGILPEPIAQHIYSTVAIISERPLDERYSRVFDVLVKAWAERKKVRITYARSNARGEPIVSERTVAPYFIEPHPAGHSCYLLCHDSVSNSLRTFKIERIREAALSQEEFVVPESFDARKRLRDAWIVTDEPPVEVRLLFHDAQAGERARENRWHTSQQEVRRDDGKLELRFTVAGLIEIQSWVLSWGSAVEVLAPEDLRDHIAAIVRTTANRYDSQAVKTPA